MVTWPICRASPPARPPCGKACCWVTGSRMGVVLALLAMEVRTVIIVAAAVLGTKLFCEAQASIKHFPSTEKCSSDSSGLTCGWFRSLVMNFLNTSPFCGPGGRVPDRVVRPQSRGTKDCSPVAPSTGVPTECRRTPAAARPLSNCSGGIEGHPRWRKVSQGYG